VAERLELGSPDARLGTLPMLEPTRGAFLRDCGPDLRAVDRLRAAALGVGLAAQLRVRFGRQFWKSRGAGELLAELWNTGTSYAPEALAREVGAPPPSAELLLAAESP